MRSSLHERPQSALLLVELPKRLLFLILTTLIFGWIGTVAGTHRAYWTAILIVVAIGSLSHLVVINKRRVFSTIIILFILGICCWLASWQILYAATSWSTSAAVLILFGYLVLWYLPRILSPYSGWLEATFGDNKQPDSRTSRFILIAGIIGAVIGLNARTLFGVSVGNFLVILVMVLICYLLAAQGSYLVWFVALNRSR